MLKSHSAVQGLLVSHVRNVEENSVFSAMYNIGLAGLYSCRSLIEVNKLISSCVYKHGCTE